MSIEKSTKTELPSIPLFPLPYYSIARAAEQLQITEEYIIESIKCGMVRACVLFDSEKPEHSESGILGDSAIFDDVDIKMPPLTPPDSELVGVSPFQRLTFSKLDSLISTSASQAVVTDFRSEDEGFGFVSANLHGFWQISLPDEAMKVLEAEEHEPVIEVFPYRDDGWYQSFAVEKDCARVTGFLVNASKEQLVLSYHDVRSLLVAYKTGKPFNQLGYFGETQSLSLNVSAKPTRSTVAVITGLIAAHPKLGTELLSNKTEAYEAIEKLFAREGIHLGGLWPDRKTFSEWFRVNDVSRITLPLPKKP
ncbi:hypothetical protein P3385_15600 [Vibrio parahaemolyticus]|nr:hypothetical protein [Vibrio parahaemolyticus]MDF4428497.1 hypothetical protein [Vibrio parahaemolyticus]MDF4437689.1 hypothetical protein [Vibrio parahaemolyticus]MDF4446943.1 hypothetical protein [Vibrio parahaemolyticus]